MVKQTIVDLAENDEEGEEQTHRCTRWTRDEEILLTECWIESSENGQIGADRSEDSLWRQIMVGGGAQMAWVEPFSLIVYPSPQVLLDYQH
uniref:Uncharacterized protein n=1 Tax=Tanacetum cinerariifolium TaxID=118510 RepID=A0A699HSD6_TANCI|nr:hypothetical protein [Tanacetum cinerariifolium]